jgi:cytochrome b pre-mRNA-processing protein 3
MPLFGLLRRRPHERAGFELYGAAVAAARAPALYLRLGVPDSMTGRFDLVALHVALLIQRLREDADPRGPALAQAVFDAMFADMDINLREMGIGDMSIGKRVKRMWEAFHGRALSYAAAMQAADDPALAAALARNVWEGQVDGAAPGPRALAAIATAQAGHLAGQGMAALLAGRVAFLPAETLVEEQADAD